MNPWSLLAGIGIGGVTGLVKGLIAKDQEAKDRRMAAEMWRTSPWTGVKPNDVKRANVLGDVLVGATQGAAMGQSFDNMQQSKEMMDLMKAQLASGAVDGDVIISPWSSFFQRRQNPYSLGVDTKLGNNF